MQTQSNRIVVAFFLAALLFVGAGCATTNAVGPDSELAIDLEGSETGAAVGLLAAPASRNLLAWLGQFLLQAVTNTNVQLHITTTKEGAP